MAVSPIGNITHIHQNAQVGSVQHANSQVKLDFQAMVNLQEMQDKQDEIKEVRPTEETLETSDEREGDGKEPKEEKERKKEKDSEESQESDSIQTKEDGTIAHLNISV
ncbi:hypothetical protein [Helicobacter sp. MIT 05-5294]|uniref:hypothetical protein n=1 Tax=Helicobacter sp. MIT 05-5294 TaxID=1548150 RepID=UPI00051FD3D7|nr:hypothetical protein [Helicobacter sp. MIT 05-5294]TLD87007.1 hypothetical protein LS69_005010 [Helicobacter sp. MIT 05-5294]